MKGFKQYLTEAVNRDEWGFLVHPQAFWKGNSKITVDTDSQVIYTVYKDGKKGTWALDMEFRRHLCYIELSKESDYKLYISKEQ